MLSRSSALPLSGVELSSRSVPRRTLRRRTSSVAGRPDLSGPVTGSVRGELLKLSLPTTTLGELQVKQDTITGVPVAGMPATLRRVK